MAILARTAVGHLDNYPPRFKLKQYNILTDAPQIRRDFTGKGLALVERAVLARAFKDTHQTGL
jgi:hypothetical protein